MGIQAGQAFLERQPNSPLVIDADSGHGDVFQLHADFMPKALEFLARQALRKKSSS